MKLEEKNTTRNMMKNDYGDVKADKSNELNESMTIKQLSRDGYTRTIHNIGGSN